MGSQRSPAETNSGSYIETGTASAYHDWEFRTRIRVLQHKEKQRREVLKDMRGAAFARSQSPVKRSGKGQGKGIQLEAEVGAECCRDRPPHRGRVKRHTRYPVQCQAAPSHPSQIEGDGDGDVRRRRRRPGVH